MSDQQTNAPDTEQAAEEAGTGAPMAAETASLLALIDRLTALLEKSDLVELEVEAGGTGVVLRKPAALATTVSGVNVTVAGGDSAAVAAQLVASPEPPVPIVKAVVAPLTGIFYGSSSPSAPPYTAVGQHVEVGQVIGLIEAMKLFNEIKSDKSGRVVRVVAESGKLVKARQPLIEVEP
jgi:acetyl-CoA carboxylase biotin carboxyl carrier protein